LRLHGFVSKPEVQKLNRNSIFVFVNGRLIRDRTVQHAITEAYRNILPPTVFPVVLLFIEMPYVEVDVNVHPSKTECASGSSRRCTISSAIRQDGADEGASGAQFVNEIKAQPTAGQALTPGRGPSPPANLLRCSRRLCRRAMRDLRSMAESKWRRTRRSLPWGFPRTRGRGYTSPCTAGTAVPHNQVLPARMGIAAAKYLRRKKRTPTSRCWRL